MAWDPKTYEQFADERARPFLDLLRRTEDALGDAPPEPRVVDLGCGTGNRTMLLARAWPTADVLGVDSSPEMIEDATRRAASAGDDVRIRFELGDVRSWRSPDPVDVLVTNAVLQWVPGHAELLPHLVDTLAPGGVLGLQVPANGGAPSHVLLRETVGEERWAGTLSPVLRGGPTGNDAVHSATGYAELLLSAGCDRVDTWETTYLHVLDPAGRHGDDAVLQWVSGTALRPFLSALADDAERRSFTEAYGQRLRRAYPRRSYGTPFLFRRIFAVGRRAPHAS